MQITCTNLSFSYPEQATTLFDGVTFSISDGSRLGIIGPNGSGKSTLLQTMLGQRQPDAGDVTLSPSVTVGFVPQQIVLDHSEQLPINLVREADSMSSENARILLGTLGIEDDQVFQPVGLLSAGQQKRVFIACLVAARPDLLVIDELEGNLAIDAVTLLEQALLRFTGALVMVTHDAALALAIGQQFISLDGAGGWSQENLFDGSDS